MQTSAEVRAAVEEYFERFNAGDAEGAAALIADDAAAFVTGTQRIGEGREHWVQSLTAYAGAGAAFESADVRAWAAGEMGWAVDEPTMVLPEGLRLKLRMTAVLQRADDGGYRMLHQHFSFAVPDEVSDEHAAAWRMQLRLTAP
jgi:ketosteroid isomerase-like protein